MTQTRREHWDRAHTDKTDAELSWYQEHPRRSLELIERARVKRDGAIIDVGGGSSRLVDHLLEFGYRDVTVLDVSARALELTRQRMARSSPAPVKWIHADVTEWMPEFSYDLWHDRAVFHFLTEAGDRDAYVERMRMGLNPGGHVIIATFDLDGPERCSGLPVVRYSPEALASELGDEFRRIESAREEHLTPGGVLQRFQFSRFVRA